MHPLNAQNRAQEGLKWRMVPLCRGELCLCSTADQQHTTLPLPAEEKGQVRNSAGANQHIAPLSSAQVCGFTPVEVWPVVADTGPENVWGYA